METTITELFDSKNRRFEIPSYQRAYSWEKMQIEQFIEDLKNAENQYYLGHYLFETKEQDENTLLVIDGQQRLTTCIIFFSALRTELLKRHENGENITIDLDDIKDYYLRDIRKETQKFFTVRDDNNYFVEEIVDSNDDHKIELNTTSKIRIKSAKDLFSECFKTMTTATLGKWCGLIERATITQYVVKDKIQATQVFAFQNDRGKKLSNLEIIKAYFMLQIYLSNKGKERIEEHIRFLEDELTNIYRQIVRIELDEDEVLNYYWRSISGKGYYSEEVVKGVKDCLNALESDKITWIRDFTSGLSRAFLTVEKVEYSKNSLVIDLLYLNNMAISYPFIIKAHGLGALVKDIDRLIKLLENITFRYLLRGGRAEIESRLNHYLVNFTLSDQIDKIVDEIIAKLKYDGWWFYWNDNSMMEYLGGHFYQNRVDNYVLWKYELYISDPEHKRPHNISFNDLIQNENIEHIAPQTPTDGNPVANGYGIYDDKDTPENGIASGNWLNCIGNLMLIARGHNITIGNKPFTKKLNSYGEANLLNQQKEIVTFINDRNDPLWDAYTIKKRKEAILLAALKIWDINAI